MSAYSVSGGTDGRRRAESAVSRIGGWAWEPSVCHKRLARRYIPRALLGSSLPPSSSTVDTSKKCGWALLAVLSSSSLTCDGGPKRSINVCCWSSLSGVPRNTRTPSCASASSIALTSSVVSGWPGSMSCASAAKVFPSRVSCMVVSLRFKSDQVSAWHLRGGNRKALNWYRSILGTRGGAAIAIDDGRP